MKGTRGTRAPPYVPSAEREYLDGLWAQEDQYVDAAQVPILAKSQVFQRSAQQDQNAHKDQGTTASISTLRPKPQVAPVVPMWERETVDQGSKTGQSMRDAEELRREFDDVIENLEARRVDFDAATLEVTKAKALESKIENEIRSLHEEEDMLLVKQPPATERMLRVRQWAAGCATSLAEQRKMVEARELELEAAAARLRAAEAELDFLADARQALDMTLASETDARRDVAQALAAREERAARGYVSKLEREAERMGQLAITQQRLKDTHIQAAQEAAEKARQWLKKGMERVRRNMAKGKEVVAAQNEARRLAVMGLKDNLSRVREEVAQKAALYRQLQKQKQEVQDKEFQDLIERGLNPYEIHRKKDMEAQVARQRAALQERIMARKIVIADQLAKEEAVHQRELQLQEEERQAAIQFQREMGRAAQEAKTDEYMKNTTVNHSVLLDPTGRMPVDPSQAVVAKTNTFGSGRSTQALLDRMTQKHPDVKAKDLLVPVKYRSIEEGDSDGESSEDSIEIGRPKPAMTERSGYTAGTGLTQGTASQWHASDRDVDLGIRDKKGGDWKQLETRKLTKLERSMLEAAKTRHKEGIAAPKSMMGKDFGGDAFITTPAVVEFKDFDVGQTYTIKVIITNRSYAKNTFRVIEVPPEYGSVLEASYKLPGHIATGVGADVMLTFTPKANEDIFTHVDMLAETGPFQIPIRCLTKKAALRTSTSAVNFGPGVILGESTTCTFSLINEGALEVEYSVTPVNSKLEQVLAEDGSEVETQPCVPPQARPSLRPGQGTSQAGNVPLEVPPFTIYQHHGTVSGYKQAHITVRFAPSAGITSQQRLRIDYRVPGQRRLQVPSDMIDLEGLGRDVPVFLERSNIDFCCVMVDHTYREKLVVRNGANTAMKVSVPNRPDVADYFEFSPNFGFVQAGEAFPITILFKPRTSILTQCARFLEEAEGGGPVLKVPMKVTVPDQKLPVTFTLLARVTTTDLIFTPAKLDFGPCVLGEATGVVVRIRNPSALPQAFGCTNLPAGIGVFPNHGFGYILPGEAIERIVTFQPPIPGPQNLNLTARTLAGRTFNLPATAFGVQPTLRLSHNKIEFPATPFNDESNVSVVLFNTSGTPQAFEFGVPPHSGLKLHPHVGEVQPNSSLRIQIDYAPLPEEHSDEESEEEEEEEEEPKPMPFVRTGSKASPPQVQAPSQSKAQKAKSSAPAPGKSRIGGHVSPGTEAGGEQEQGSSPRKESDDADQDPNSWYRWQQHSIPCFIRPPGYTPEASTALSSTAIAAGAVHPSPSGMKGSEGGAGKEGEDGSSSSRSVQALHLAVTTCAVQPDVVLRSDLNWVEDKRCYELDFGPVPVGQRVTRSIDLYNQGLEAAQLSSLPLDHRELFAVVNAWRLIKPGGRFRSLLAFTPQHRASYLQMLTISSGRTRIRIALKGQGISPELRLEPATLTSTGLDLGDVYKNESAQATFNVINVCPFPLSFSMMFNGVPDHNLQNRPAFFCRPSEGTLAQGEKCEVTLVFRPSSQRPYFEDNLQVHVPNQHDQLIIPVKGRCWEEGLYVSGPEYPTPHEDPFMERQLATLAQGVLVAQQQQQAAAAAAVAVAASFGVAAGDKGNKGGKLSGKGVRPTSASSAAVPAGALQGAGLGPPSLIEPEPPQGVIAMAPSPSPTRRLVMKLKGHLYLGEIASMVFEVGSLRSTFNGASAGELLLDEVPQSAKAAGWSVDAQRVTLGAGDKKAITVRYTAPQEAHAGMAAFFGHAEAMELSVGATLRGCSPPPPTPEGRRVLLVFKITLQPGVRAANEKPPAGVTPVPAEGEAAAAPPIPRARALPSRKG